MKRLLLALGVIVLIAVVAAGVMGTSIYRRSMEPFKGYPSKELFVEIPVGSSAPDIGRRLVEAGVVRDLLTFRITLWRSGQARNLRAGEYRFDRPMTAKNVVDTFALEYLSDFASMESEASGNARRIMASIGTRR